MISCGFAASFCDLYHRWTVGSPGNRRPCFGAVILPFYLYVIRQLSDMSFVLISVAIGGSMAWFHNV